MPVYRCSACKTKLSWKPWVWILILFFAYEQVLAKYVVCDLLRCPSFITNMRLMMSAFFLISPQKREVCGMGKWSGAQACFWLLRFISWLLSGEVTGPVIFLLQAWDCFLICNMLTLVVLSSKGCCEDWTHTQQTLEVLAVFYCFNMSYCDDGSHWAVWR